MPRHKAREKKFWPDDPFPFNDREAVVMHSSGRIISPDQYDLAVAAAKTVQRERRTGGRLSGENRRKNAEDKLHAIEMIKVKARRKLTDTEAARIYLVDEDPDWLQHTEKERKRKIQNLAQVISNTRRKKRSAYLARV